MILAANPSTLVNMARAGDQEKESLIRDFHDGTLNPRLEIPGEVRADLESRLRRRHPERAGELEAVVERTGTLYPRITGRAVVFSATGRAAASALSASLSTLLWQHAGPGRRSHRQ